MALNFLKIQSNYLDPREKSLLLTNKTAISVGIINLKQGMFEVSTENVKKLAKTALTFCAEFENHAFIQE